MDAPVAYTFDLIYFEHFLLILVRITMFLFIAPFFAQNGVPGETKIGLSCLLSIIVLYMIAPEEEIYSSAIGYGMLVLKEGITGLLLGYAANICNSIILFAGNVIDMDIGISMATQFDPSMSTQVTVTGNLYYHFMLLLMLTMNMHQYILRAVIDSFTMIPLGGMVFHSDHLLLSMVAHVTNLFILAFRIVLPVFATILVMNCVLGVMAKVAPQMNMFAVGVQMKIMAGFAVILVMVFLFPQVVDIVAGQMRINLRNFAEGMMP